MVIAALITGCAPEGPRAVVEGKKCLDRADYAQAIQEFRIATQLLPTNALAFNYLGLAYHQAGQQMEAERAYSRALALNHDLAEVHYNLGCLWLAHSNKLEQAKSEFTAYLLRQPNSAEGWLKLGQAQLRSRELQAAEKSLAEALRLAPHNPEALTSLGWVRYQRKKPNEAAQLFTKALKDQPDYSPALLNLAIVSQQDLNDPRLALQMYRQYLAQKPAPETERAISAIVRQLERDLTPPPRESITNTSAVTVAQSTLPTNVTRLPTAELARSGSVPKPTPTNPVRDSTLVKSEQMTNPVKTGLPANTPKQVVSTNPVPAENIEVVNLGGEPVIRPAEDIVPPKVPSRPQTSEAPREYQAIASVPADQRTQKRGFFQRINPINLFSHDPKSSTATPPALTVAPSSGTLTNATTVDLRKFPRYAYLSPEQPGPGDRTAAERVFTQGVQAQQAHRLSEAIQAYRRAASLDPAFYDAHYNLGLAASQNSNLPLALASYETALAIQPDSLDARYNFGLVLKQAGYVLDAVAEFDKILAKYPNDGRAHLALGNLYAQQLNDPGRARQHYLAVLAVAPQSPQAGAIRYWLTDHPK
jgi:tetratricopeptide (TPR) repeat protein